MTYDYTEAEVRALRDEVRKVQGEQWSQGIEQTNIKCFGFLFLVMAVVLSVALSTAIAEDRCDDPAEEPTEIDQPGGSS